MKKQMEAGDLAKLEMQMNELIGDLQSICLVARVGTGTVVSYGLASTLPPNPPVDTTPEGVCRAAEDKKDLEDIESLKEQIYAMCAQAKDKLEPAQIASIKDSTDRICKLFLAYSSSSVSGEKAQIMLLRELSVPAVGCQALFEMGTHGIDSLFPKVDTLYFETRSMGPFRDPRNMTRGKGCRGKNKTKETAPVPQHKLPSMNMVALENGGKQGMLPLTHLGSAMAKQGLESVRQVYHALSLQRALTPGEMETDEAWTNEAFRAHENSVFEYCQTSALFQALGKEFPWELILDGELRKDIDDPTLVEIQKGKANFLFIQTQGLVEDGKSLTTNMTYLSIPEKKYGAMAELPCLDNHNSLSEQYGETIPDMDLRVVFIAPLGVAVDVCGFASPSPDPGDQAVSALVAAGVKGKTVPVGDRTGYLIPVAFTPSPHTVEVKTALQTIAGLVGVNPQTLLCHMMHSVEHGYTTSTTGKQIPNANIFVNFSRPGKRKLVDAVENNVDVLCSVAASEDVPDLAPFVTILRKEITIYTLDGHVTTREFGLQIVDLFKEAGQSIPDADGVAGFCELLTGGNVSRCERSSGDAFKASECLLGCVRLVKMHTGIRCMVDPIKFLMHEAILIQRDYEDENVQTEFTTTGSTVVYKVDNTMADNSVYILNFRLTNMGQKQLFLRARYEERDGTFDEADCCDFSMKQNECQDMEFPLEYNADEASYGTWRILNVESGKEELVYLFHFNV